MTDPTLTARAPKPFALGIIHFIGIGGIGMSGIAELMHNLGYTVQGSDLAENYNIMRLQKLGITCHIGHGAENIDSAKVVVVSSAVKPDNPEYQAARARHIPIVRRAEMLAELMRFKWSVAVAGTHGKTTTTSLVATLLDGGGLDPTIVNGGVINALGTNSRLGAGDWMVVESDESDGSFLKLPATVGIVTNIDPEHMEHYGDFDAVRGAYKTFIENLPFFGFAICCTDHPEVAALVQKITDRRIISYGFMHGTDAHISNVRVNGMTQVFDLLYRGQQITDISLPMLGAHNISNATASIVVALELGMTPAAIKHALADFAGVKRRFTKTGEHNGITIIDDYGHHPVEIAAVLKAARQAAGSNKVIAVMQPHRYTRLSSLFNEFCSCFGDADVVLVSDIYAAGEAPIPGATREALISGLAKQGHKAVHGIANPDNLVTQISALAKPGDYVICLGAGTVTNWAYALPEQLAALQSKAA